MLGEWGGNSYLLQLYTIISYTLKSIHDHTDERGPWWEGQTWLLSRRLCCQAPPWSENHVSPRDQLNHDTANEDGLKRGVISFVGEDVRARGAGVGTGAHLSGRAQLWGGWPWQAAAEGTGPGLWLLETEQRASHGPGLEDRAGTAETKGTVAPPHREKAGDHMSSCHAWC